ncbi:conserved hypothetical protein [Nostocoides japonicum T1-X7]|uniref:Uncharacterized protein n=1 Tax=Nostocoides japonicum T1-X7 TaxID=1194083 RepID=A0A077LSP3_9MICO|nr:hypothetical protein [Tetrasphaera japonica]CCH76083.1 conserved hypothetical protein [Tetrasphaera japonica T1-X7]
MSTGVLLLRGPSATAARWVGRGLVSARVIAHGPWTAVQLVGDRARSAPPYDDAARALMARPMGRRLRPAVGFFVTDGTGVLTVRPKGWHSRLTWLVWTPDTGARPAPGLPPVRVDDLRHLAPGVSASEIRRALSTRPADPVAWLSGILVTLGLPGAGLLTGAEEGGAVVHPSAASVRRFDAMVADDRDHRAELGDPP